MKLLYSSILYIFLLLAFFNLVDANKNYNNATRIKGKANYTERGVLDMLNAKQKIAMNQLIGFYVMEDSSKSDKCKTDSTRLKYGIRNLETWALKMVDASAKLQTGIINGNIMEFGDFRECVSVHEYNDGDPIQGKMCTLNMPLGGSLVVKILKMRNMSNSRLKELEMFLGSIRLFWDVCVPESCPHERVLDHFQKRISPLVEGLAVDFEMTSMDCVHKPDGTLKKEELAVICLILFLLFMVIICTLIDAYMKQEEEKTHFVHIFSMYRNLPILFGQNDSSELQCLHGIRACSIAYVIVGHRFFLTLFFPAINMLEITDWLLTYPSTFILGGTVSVDSFFLVSGLVLTYHLCGHYDSGKPFNIPWYILYRYLRLTPPMAVVILVYMYLLPHLGSGPIWEKTWGGLALSCRKYWWTSILYIQNYVNPQQICILQTWYSSCEFQFYLFAPFLIYPIWRYKILGKVIYATVFVVSLVPSFLISYLTEARANALMSSTFTESAYFRFIYITAYSRSSTYIIGVGLGYLIHKTKDKKVKMNLPVLILGWSISAVTLLTVTLIYHNFQQDSFEYDVLKMSSFITFSRSAWTFSLAWIVWVCVHGYGGIINSILSIYFFKVIGRLTYGMYLVHICFQFLSNGASKQSLYFSNFTLLTKFFGDFCVSVLLSILLNLTIEVPVASAMKMYTRKK